jgi:hypothetical protein
VSLTGCGKRPLAAFTYVTRVIPRVVNLRGSPYGHGTRACLGRLGMGGKNEQFASEIRGAHRLAPVRRRKTHDPSASRTLLRPCWTAILLILRVILTPTKHVS